ncbi:MAG: type pullulanase [Actinomycetota bacterium]
MSTFTKSIRKRLLPAILAFALIAPVSITVTSASAAGACPTAQCATLTVHYKRTSVPPSYGDWGLWLWAFRADPGLPESQVTPFSGSQLDANGFAVLTTQVPITPNVTQLGLIPRLKSGWTKDVDVDRLVNLDSNKTAEIWIQQGDAYIYNNSSFTLPSEIWEASIQTFKTIKVTLSKPNGTAAAGFSITGVDAPAIEKVEKIKDLNNGTTSSNKQWLITTATDIPLGSNLTLVHQDADPARTFGSRLINPAAIFTSTEFVNAYTYDGDDLGATYTSAKTDFRVWAPTASEVSLLTYASADAAKNTATVTPMVKSVKGTWTASLSGDRHLQVYMYRVTVGGNTEEAVDPYARSVTANGVRGVVVDLAKTNPAGFVAQAKPAFSGKAADSIMYELHVRDASIEPSSGVKAADRGKFKGLAQLGTSVKVGKVSGSTGLSYMKELGVTHVQLLPMYDYASGGDELNPTFNWGYDPEHFNVPEGQYSSDPTNPVARITELKTAVQAMHKAGLRVTMDVVYGHVASATEFSQNLIVPGYWFRKDASGNLTNRSGCGNDTATERPMVRKFIVDSMKYWTKEYKLDGFRIDQMGLWDVTTMNQVANAVRAIEPKATIIGEAWSMGGDSGQPQGNQTQLVNMPGIGGFNDGIRNAVKGSPDGLSDGGYVNGNPGGTLTALKAGIIGHTPSNVLTVPWQTLDAGQSVNYAEAHDNMTLFDKLWAVNNQQSRPAVAKQSRQISSLLFASQGTAFIQAGQEFLRTKNGDHNSYRSSDAVNSLKWTERITQKVTVDYNKGLIAMRKAHPAFRLNTPASIQANLKFLNAPNNVLAFSLNGKAVKDKWATIVVISNPNSTTQKVNLPSVGDWKVVVSGDKAGVATLSTLKKAKVASVAANSTLIIWK